METLPAFPQIAHHQWSSPSDELQPYFFVDVNELLLRKSFLITK